MPFKYMLLAGRLLLGSFYLISGLNWFFGYMPLPSMHSPLDAHMKHPVVLEMIKTGWMFQAAKIIEISVGLALLTNRLVPALLAVAAPVAFITFMLDAMILGDIWNWVTGAATTAYLLYKLYDMVIGGLCILLLHVWLMLCYFDCYRPMLAWKAAPRQLGTVIGEEEGNAGRRGPARMAFLAFGWLALALQAWNLYLFIGLIGARE